MWIVFAMLGKFPIVESYVVPIYGLLNIFEHKYLYCVSTKQAMTYFFLNSTYVRIIWLHQMS